MTHTFTIPGRLPGLNEVTNANRTHWAAGAKQKKLFTEGIAWVLREQARHLTKPIDAAWYTFFWHCANKRRDPDNVASACKFVMDALQAAGIIRNDGWDEVVSITHLFAVDKANPRLELKIQEVTNDGL